MASPYTFFMRAILFFLFGCLSLCKTIDGQQRFYVDGFVKGVSNGTVVVYYQKGDSTIRVEKDSVSLVKGIFSISGYITYPQQMNISVIAPGIDKLSQSFLITGGRQTLYSNINSDTFSYKHPYVTGQPIHKEYNEVYSTFRKEVIRKYDLLTESMASTYEKFKGKVPSRIADSLEIEKRLIYQSFDSVLVEYIKTYPNSYVGLWALKDYSQGKGYKNEFQKAYDYLSDNLKQTYIGQQIAGYLEKSKNLQVGKTFPVISLLTVQGKKITKLNYTKNAYTLVEFWFSSCTPCIQLVPSLKQLQALFPGKLHLVSISTDQRTQYEKLKKVVHDHKMNWLQLWDPEGSTIQTFNINSYPANLLISKKGIVIVSNISIAALTKLLTDGDNE